MKKFILMGLCLLSCSLWAAPAATVLFTKNDVKVASGQTLTRGSSLQVGDSIITGKESLTKIKYTNGTFVTLGEKSTYKILAYSPKQGDVEIKAELSAGIIDQRTTHKTKEELKTPTIALAISGTHFGASVSDCKSIAPTRTANSVTCTATVSVLVTEGVVVEKNPDGKSTPIKNGQTTSFNDKGNIVATPPNAENQLKKMETVAEELPTTVTEDTVEPMAETEPKVGLKVELEASPETRLRVRIDRAEGEVAMAAAEATPPVAASLQTEIGATALIQTTTQISTVEVSAAIAAANQAALLATITACIGF